MRLSTISLTLTLLFPAICSADTIHVPADRPTIQAGIDAAANGDVVLVAPGYYVENINFMGKGITVKSSGGAYVTLIDGGQPVDPDFASVVLFNSGEQRDSILEGFALANGKGTYCSSHNQSHHGGGIYCFESSPIIRNNIICYNSGYYGGGIYCIDWYPNPPQPSNPLLKNNYIISNTATGDGGGIYCFCSQPQMSDNKILLNSAENGGGIYSRFSDIEISNNTVSGNNATTDGGGIFTAYSESTILNNQIEANAAETGCGGGIYSCGADPFIHIYGNTISGNLAELEGGGVYIAGGIENPEYAMIVNNIISKNAAERGGGILFSWSARPTLTNNTIIGNTALEGGGLHFYWCNSDHEIDLANSILWNNSAPLGPQLYLGWQLHTCTLNVSYSDVEGGEEDVFVDYEFILNWGDGMIEADPMFADSTGDDFHLCYNSPCRGSGTNTAAALPDCDFENDPRIHQGTADMGADECHPHLYCMGDFFPGGPVEGKIIGLPGTSPVLAFISAYRRESPVPTQWGDFYLKPPFRIISLIPIPSSGVLAIPGTIPTTQPPPYEICLQALVGSELSNLFVLEIY